MSEKREPPTRLTRNAARCRACWEVIESRSVHDFVWCYCGAIFVDGGLQYLRRGGELQLIEDLSEFEGMEVRETRLEPNEEPKLVRVRMRYKSLAEEKGSDEG